LRHRGKSGGAQVLGALTLTSASIILISGIWCYYLSPTVEYTKTIERYEYMLHIEGLETKSVTFPAREGEMITVTVGMRVPFKIPPPPIDANVPIEIVEMPRKMPPHFDIQVFDPDGGLIWQDLNVTHSHFRSKALKSGNYKIEVRNLGTEIITVPLYIRRTIKLVTRPLEPGGQWLSLISLPIFGFGIWMILVEKRKK
jgi:Na+-transporting NADH:ubiquinone oxidoreductase subunit NqrC